MTRILGAMIAFNVALFALGVGGQFTRFQVQPPTRLAVPSLPADTPRLELLSARPPVPARPFVPPPEIPATPSDVQPEAKTPAGPDSTTAGPATSTAATVPAAVRTLASAGTGADSGKGSPPRATACFRAGPLTVSDSVALAELERALKNSGADGVTQVPVPDRNVRHWVYVGAAMGADAANAEAARLKAAGYQDVLALKLEDGWTISMGLFDRAERARALAERAQARGFDARVQSRSSTPARVWVQFVAPPELPGVLAKGPLRGQKVRPCPA